MVSEIHVHLVLVTKYRRDVPGDDMLRLCEQVMRKACADFEADLREFNGEADHVHLLVNYPLKMSVPALVNSLKGVSARLLRSQYTGKVNRALINGHFWSRPTSPRPAAARPCRSSASTSSSSGARPVGRGLRPDSGQRWEPRARAGGA